MMPDRNGFVVLCLVVLNQATVMKFMLEPFFGENNTLMVI